MNALIGRARGALGLLRRRCSLLLAGAVAMVGVGLVKVKMLPFDNKSEFQVVVDHPEGTPLEVTLETARQMIGVPGHACPRSRTSSSTPGTRRPSTSTGWSATTSCAASPTPPTCR